MPWWTFVVAGAFLLYFGLEKFARLWASVQAQRREELAFAAVGYLYHAGPGAGGELRPEAIADGLRVDLPDLLPALAHAELQGLVGARMYPPSGPEQRLYYYLPEPSLSVWDEHTEGSRHHGP
jgi:hypothetical protein